VSSIAKFNFNDGTLVIVTLLISVSWFFMAIPIKLSVKDKVPWVCVLAIEIVHVFKKKLCPSKQGGRCKKEWLSLFWKKIPTSSALEICHKWRLFLPLKVFDYIFIKIAPKLPFLIQVPNLFLKKHFWTHITVWSCSALVEKMWKKFQKFPSCRLLDNSVWSDKSPFFAPMKTRAAALHKVTFVWKYVQNGGASLDSFFKASWLHAWKNSHHFELYNM